MLGLDNPSWLAHQTSHTSTSTDEGRTTAAASYWAYFGLGHSARLMDRPEVFKLSPAGLSLGALLVQYLDSDSMSGSFLELGTGSGALALLLRDMGAGSIVATDISSEAISLAADNELLNFGDNRISYRAGSLFGVLEQGERFDYVVFNPPGWRNPSPHLADRLESTRGSHPLSLDAMFGGDVVAVDFLVDLPRYLTPSGRAIIGLNSLIGIQDVLSRYRKRIDGKPPLRFRLMQRNCVPLLMYADSWSPFRATLVDEFRDWREKHNAIFSEADDGAIFWSYEIIECAVSAAEPSSARHPFVATSG